MVFAGVRIVQVGGWLSLILMLGTVAAIVAIVGVAVQWVLADEPVKQ
jgi:hypothetical protein